MSENNRIPKWRRYSGELAKPFSGDEQPRRSLEKLKLLCEEFGISWPDDGRESGRSAWTRSLAASLALRHEPGFLTDQGGNYDVLFRRYKINPQTEDADFALALCLAFEHVPGMKISIKERAKPRLKASEIVTLYLAMSDVLEHTKGKVSDRELAEILVSDLRRKEILSTELADKVKQLLAENGNEKNYSTGPMVAETLRKYLRDNTLALTDLRPA